MADITYSNILNGVTDVIGNGVTFQWSGNSFMQFIDFYTSGGLTTEGTFSMSGNWYMHSMYLNGDATYDAIFTDSFDGGDRTIENLRVGGAITADLGDTRIRFIRQNTEDADSDITLGSKRVTSIETADGGTHVLTMGTGSLSQYRAFFSDVTINGNAGLLESLTTGRGDLTLNVANTRFNYVEAYDGDFEINGGSGANAGRVRHLNLFNDAPKSVVVNMNDSDFNFLHIDHGGVVNGGTGANAGRLDFLSIFSSAGETTTINGNDSEFGMIRANQGNEVITLSKNADAIVLSGGTDTVTSTAGFIGAITGYGGDKTVNLASGADIRTIGFSGGADTLHIAGRLSSADLGGNDDTVNVTGGGRIDMLRLSDGDNILSVQDNGRVFSVVAFQGDDTITMSGGQIDTANLFEGDNTVTLTGGDMRYLKTLDGDDVVTVTGSGRLDIVNLGSGTNNLLLSMAENTFTEIVVSYEGRDTITTGAGGVGAIRTNGGRDIITTGTGWVELINAGDTADVITTNGNVGTIRGQDGNDKIFTGGNVDQILGGDGKDTIDTRGGGWFGQIDAGNDNDKVFVGAEAGGQVRLGSGNDTLFVQDINPDFGLQIQGGGGEDTLNFAAFSKGVYFTLDSNGIWQNVGDPTGDPSTPNAGYFSETSIENVAGSDFDDTLIGDQFSNTLQGRGGNDTLEGGAGDDDLRGGGNADTLNGGSGSDALRGDGAGDILNGGAGDDRLFGGAASDVFVFDNNANAGNDKIKDWEDGRDQIDLTDHGFANFGQVLALASNAGSLNMKLDFANGTQLLIENFRLADFDASDVILS